MAVSRAMCAECHPECQSQKRSLSPKQEKGSLKHWPDSFWSNCSLKWEDESLDKVKSTLCSVYSIYPNQPYGTVSLSFFYSCFLLFLLELFFFIKYSQRFPMTFLFLYISFSVHKWLFLRLSFVYCVLDAPVKWCEVYLYSGTLSLVQCLFSPQLLMLEVAAGQPAFINESRPDCPQ